MLCFWYANFGYFLLKKVDADDLRLVVLIHKESAYNSVSTGNKCMVHRHCIESTQDAHF